MTTDVPRAAELIRRPIERRAIPLDDSKEHDMSIRVYVTERGMGRREIPNGPFPITKAQLLEARRLFAEERAADPAKAAAIGLEPMLYGTSLSPQSAARDHLRTVAPHLSSFDQNVLGFAVTDPTVEIEEES